MSNKKGTTYTSMFWYCETYSVEIYSGEMKKSSAGMRYFDILTCHYHFFMDDDGNIANHIAKVTLPGGASFYIDGDEMEGIAESLPVVNFEDYNNPETE